MADATTTNTFTNAPDFTLDELLASQTAARQHLDNTPPPEALENITHLLAPGLQRVRELLRCPVLVSSGYRSPAVNRAVGGAKDSQHMRGQAADFTAPRFGSPLQVARVIAAHAGEIRFDQLIMEGTWVHVSFAGEPRGQVLTAHFGAGWVHYTEGLL